MPWTINSEIYPLWARSTGNACAAGVNWTFNILVSLTFLHLAQYFTYYGQFRASPIWSCRCSLASCRGDSRCRPAHGRLPQLQVSPHTGRGLTFDAAANPSIGADAAG